MPLDNDTRGWIMTCVSGIACILGSSVICVDLIVRQFPGKRDFSIQDSNGFLSASLSLSFGVMLFSSLYKMLPNAKKYLIQGGYSPKQAAWLLIALFLGGVLCIQVLSSFLHHYIPHHVVDCDHTHDDEALEEMEEHHHDHVHGEGSTRSNGSRHQESASVSDEETPLLSRQGSNGQLGLNQTEPEMAEQHPGNPDTAFTPKPSFMPRTLTRTFTALGGYEKSTCDEVGPCMGYSDPCGADCFRAVSRRSSHGPGLVRQGTFGRSFAGPLRFAVPEDDEDSAAQSPQTQQAKPSGVKRNVSQTSFDHVPLARSRSATHHFHHQPTQNGHPDGSKKRRPSSSFSMGQESHAQAHHHHIPNNAFMSIGLQTSIAIAVHKLPEGFITYATNHANPTLGFSVFMALFIHNITEGFAMALPLYLALNSRVKAIIWSSILGGASQPLGAGLAALWFKMAGEGSMKPGDRVYGGMFAVTAGIMTSVALSLFSESLSMTHSKGLCITFAFLGMGVLGISSALTA